MTQDLQAEEVITFSGLDKFLFEDFADDNNIVSSDIQANNIMYALRNLKESIEKTNDTKKEYMEFFDKKVTQLEKAETFLKTMLENYVRSKEENVRTPNGTAYLVTRKSYNYPEMEALVAFAKDKGLPVKVVESVSKTDIKNFHAEYGELPEGASVSENTSMTIRW